MNRGRPNLDTLAMEPRVEVIEEIMAGHDVWSSPQERIIATSMLIEQGYPRVSIARLLGVSQKTVSRYVAQLEAS